MHKEMWKDVQGWEGRYKISNLGRIMGPQQELRTQVSRAGYMIVSFNTVGIWPRKKYQYKLHRLMYTHFIGPIPEGYVVDHINRNKSDNYLANLRLANRAQNVWNAAKVQTATSSRYRGVSHRISGKKHWEASLQNNGKRVYLGSCFSEVEAAIVYDLEALKTRNEYAATNLLHRADSLVSKESVCAH